MAERENHWAELVSSAHSAGLSAGNAIIPTPMHIRGYAPVMGGACGFAWITIKPATSAFARWLKKAGHASKAYGGGLMVWVGEFGQSMARKEAYAHAYAEVIREGGFSAYASSRMD